MPVAMAKPLDELTALNESPSEKEGKLPPYSETQTYLSPLNESPSEKEGKSTTTYPLHLLLASLNESPSEKEGKFVPWAAHW